MVRLVGLLHSPFIKHPLTSNNFHAWTLGPGRPEFKSQLHHLLLGDLRQVTFSL